MKRSSTDVPLYNNTAVWSQQTVQQGSIQAPTQRQTKALDVDSAGQEAVRLLTSSPPQAKEFARLLDDMHEQGIRTLKISGTQIGPQGYEVLVRALSEPYRLRDQLRDLDFSNTEFPQFTSLALAIKRNHNGQLRYLNLENTHFPAARGGEGVDLNRKIYLQPSHLELVLDIVEANPELRYLNLNHQDLLGSTKGLSDPRSFHRDAPVYRLMNICRRRHSKIEELGLQHCWLSDHDLGNIASMLNAARANGQQCLRVLELQGNDPHGQFDWRHFLMQLNGHPSLAHLCLPDAAYSGASGYLALDEDKQKAVAKSLSDCPQLSQLEPRELADDPHVKAQLWQRTTEMRHAHFTNLVAPLSTENLNQVPTRVPPRESLNPDQVLPAYLTPSVEQGQGIETL